MVRLLETWPNFRISEWAAGIPVNWQAHQMYIDGLLKAGLLA